ncbi:M23 family metallopeptidase [Sphingomonas sp. VNH70]|uniref:M23 family metallopeptidase n=1 Tax=Sphingomonas silueang TaxID=3156617 RepID=UPI0032B46266
MNRIGWAFLGLFALGGLFVAFFVDFGGRPAAPQPAAALPTAAAGAVGAAPGQLLVPVRGVDPAALRGSWGEVRGDGTRGHTGTDIMAPLGTPVVAAADGVVEKRFFSPGGGGITLYVRAPDRRLSYYYAHLAGYAAGSEEGRGVRAGQVIGYVGDSGNAGRGNTHLHFGIERTDPAAPWYRGQAIDPYPLLARGARAE